MIVISLISQKGGAGKTTLARNLAVLAAEEGPSYLVDRDPRQGTATRWAERREGLTEGDEPPGPVLINDLGEGGLTHAVKRLRDKPGFLFVDTRPAVTEAEAEAARVSDLVLVPVRPNGEDLQAIGDTLAMIRGAKARCGIVLNAARTDRRALEAYRVLGRFGVPVCPAFLRDRLAHPDAYVAALAVSEMRTPGGRAATVEVREVWRWAQEVIREQV